MNPSKSFWNELVRVMYDENPHEFKNIDGTSPTDELLAILRSENESLRESLINEGKMDKDGNIIYQSSELTEQEAILIWERFHNKKWNPTDKQ